MLVTCSSYIFCQYISLGVLDSVKPMILMVIPMTSKQSQCYVTVLEKAHHKKLIISPIQFCTFDPLQGNNAVQEDKKQNLLDFTQKLCHEGNKCPYDTRHLREIYRINVTF